MRDKIDAGLKARFLYDCVTHAEVPEPIGNIFGRPPYEPKPFDVSVTRSSPPEWAAAALASSLEYARSGSVVVPDDVPKQMSVAEKAGVVALTVCGSNPDNAGGSGECFAAFINDLLQSRSHDIALKWNHLLWHVLAGLRKLVPIKSTVFRASPVPIVGLEDTYRVGTTVSWNCFAFAALSEGDATDIVGGSVAVMFAVTSCNARNLRGFTRHGGDEVVFEPFTRFTVDAVEKIGECFVVRMTEQPESSENDGKCAMLTTDDPFAFESHYHVCGQWMLFTRRDVNKNSFIWHVDAEICVMIEWGQNRTICFENSLGGFTLPLSAKSISLTPSKRTGLMIGIKKNADADPVCAEAKGTLGISGATVTVAPKSDIVIDLDGAKLTFCSTEPKVIIQSQAITSARMQLDEKTTISDFDTAAKGSSTANGSEPRQTQKKGCCAIC